MNLHPIFVHFPIALLTVYSILEIVRIKQLNKLTYWFYIKATLVILGSASTLFALFSGQMIEQAFEQSHGYIVEVHSLWAKISTLIFAVIAFSYVISWIKKQFIYDFSKIAVIGFVWTICGKFEHIVLETKLILILVIFGLVAITVTGALGGIIAFGADTDPLTKLIYPLLQK